MKKYENVYYSYGLKRCGDHYHDDTESFMDLRTSKLCYTQPAPYTNTAIIAGEITTDSAINKLFREFFIKGMQFNNKYRIVLLKR